MKRPTRSPSKTRRAAPRHQTRILRVAGARPPPAISGDAAALFLNIDETVTGLISRPGLVHAPPSLVRLLFALRHKVGGALAIMSGRRLADIDWLLWPAVLPGVGESGAELRSDISDPGSEGNCIYAHLAARLRERFLGDDGIVVRERAKGVTLDFRRAQHRRIECVTSMRELTSWCDDLEVVEHATCVQTRPIGAAGSALEEIMQRPPFAGRIPVYVGEDVADRAAFAMARQLGGFGVTVGRKAGGAATYQLKSLRQIDTWLRPPRSH